MGLRLLSAPVPLGSITDVELFSRDALRRGLRMMPGARLDLQAETDALTFLIEELFELWQRYDARLNTSFTKYVYPILPRRVVDWYRGEFGDTRYTPRPTLDEYRDELALVVDHRTSNDEVLTVTLFARRLDREAGLALSV